MLAALAAAICLHACGGDNPVNPNSDPEPAPVVDPDNGEVSFEIKSDGIQGEGTGASPYIITPENALNLVIRQKSRYTDMDWSVFECEPLATINASLGKDVVYAESLDLLTSLAGEGGGIAVLPCTDFPVSTCWNVVGDFHVQVD